jgi:hypothetical protein
MKNIHKLNENIYITSDEEIKEGDWMYYKHFREDIVCKYDTMNGQNTNVNEHKPFYQKIILTTDQELIKDCVQAIDDEFLEWFVNNSSCESVEVDKNWNYPLDKSWEYKIIIPKEKPKITNCGNKNCQSGVINGVNPKLCRKCNPKEEHPNQIKCYCGHTTTCDCSPLEEPKQFTPEMLVDLKQGLDNAIQKSNPLFPNYKHLNKQETLEEIRKYAELSYYNGDEINAFVNGAKWQQERMYSEEDLRNAYRWGTTVNHGTKKHFNEWFKQFKKK